jgi:serine protease Do
VDLNLFDFDYDLTFIVFFLNAEKKVYARYGGRDSQSADDRLSPKGLHYTMQSVLSMAMKEDKVFAPKSGETPKFIKDITSGTSHGCTHCHQVKETLNAKARKAGEWSREMIWRYPLPENLGIVLDVTRSDTIRDVKAKSPAADCGLKKGGVLKRLNGVPIHSIADAQYALDIAPKAGSIPVVWQQNGKTHAEKLALEEGWRKTDISWRPSMRDLIPSIRLGGADLTAAEKKKFGLSEKQLAFREKEPVFKQALEAGIRAGDIIFGVDNKPFEMTMTHFQDYIRSTYIVGDKVTVDILRNGNREKVTMTLSK